MSRRTTIIIVFVVVIALGYGLFAFWSAQSAVPTAFTQARLQGAVVAQNIVDLSNQSTADLTKVNQFDKDGDYTDALTLTTSIASSSQEMRDEAVSLSNDVSDMTKSLSSISSFSAQQAALESISSRLALINQLVNYSGDLGNLLDVLRDHFTGKSYDNTQVQSLVNQINTDVNAINNFNTQANQSMNTFDKLTGSSN
jgi:flagellar basal body-associated protein FliL